MLKLLFALASMVLVSFLFALPMGGFYFGFVNCEGCGWNVLGRVFIGFVMAVLTTFSFGYPPRNEGGVGEPYNAWTYIYVAWALNIVLILLDAFVISPRTKDNRWSARKSRST